MTKPSVSNVRNVGKPKAKKPKGKVASRKSEKQKALEAQFKKEQKRALALIARREKAGYEVDAKLKERASKRPKRITAGSLNRVSAITSDVVYKKSKYNLNVNGLMKTVRGDVAKEVLRKQRADARAKKRTSDKLTDLILGRKVKPFRISRYKNPNGRGKKVLTRLYTKPKDKKRIIDSIPRSDVLNYENYWHENQEGFEHFAANAEAFFDDHLAQLHEIGARTPEPFGKFAMLLESMIDKFGHERVAVWYAKSKPPHQIDREYYADYMPRADKYFQSFLNSGFIWVEGKNEMLEFQRDLKDMLERYAEENNADGYSQAMEDHVLTGDETLTQESNELLNKKYKEAKKNVIKFEPKEDEEGWL